MYEYDLVEGIKEGLETIHHAEEGWLQMETNWLNGERHGFERIYEITGQLLSDTNFSSGIKDGLARFFDSFGNLESEEIYFEGLGYETGGREKSLSAGTTVDIDRDAIQQSIEDAMNSLNENLNIDIGSGSLEDLLGSAESLLGSLTSGDGASDLLGSLSGLLSGDTASLSSLGDLNLSLDGDCDDNESASIFSSFTCLFQ